MVQWAEQIQDSSLRDLQRSSHGIGPNGLTFVRVSDLNYLYSMPFHHLDKIGDITYIGYTDGKSWLVKKLIEGEGGMMMLYASIIDNETYLGYSSAWVDRENLVYVNLEGA